jgi:O-antigen ligase
MYTGSRSCWIGFAFSIFILLLIKKPSWIPLIMILGIISIPFLPDYIQRRLITIVNFDTDSSALYRVKIFNTVLPMIQDYWNTGVGLGTDIFMKISSRYYLYTKKIPVHTHILYTQILLEMGILGLLTFLWTIIRNIKNSIKEIVVTEDKFLANILATGVASLAGILLVSFVEYIWYYPRVMLIFWVVISLTMSGIYISRTSRRKSFL